MVCRHVAGRTGVEFDRVPMPLCEQVAFLLYGFGRTGRTFASELLC